MANYAARRITQDGRDSSLKDVLAAKGTLDGRDVNGARRAGDPLAAEVWDRAMRYLAVGCVNICRMLDPDEIILTGGLTNAGDDLMEPLMEHFTRMHWVLAEPMTRIRPSALGNTAGVIGAAGVAWQAFAPGAL
jgi:glucokinase